MNRAKKIIQQALKHGFDLSGLPGYNAKEFRDGLFAYLVEKKFFVSEENQNLYIGYEIFDDVMEVTFDKETMKVHPLTDEGFFEVLIHLFRYVSLCSQKVTQDDEEETESYSEESSEDLWL